MTDTITPAVLAAQATGGDQPGRISAAMVKELYRKGIDDIRWEVRNYWLNWSFVLGEQNITWDNRMARPDVLALTNPNRTNAVNNRLWPATRVLMAKLLRRPLEFDVAPAEPDDAAVGGARIAEAAINDTARQHRWEQLRLDNVWDTWLGGVACLALEWHPAKHQAVGETDRGDQYGSGDISEYALSIAEIATEPGCRDIETARYWIRAAALPPKEVQDLYRLEKTPVADASAMLSPLQQRLVDLGSESGGSPALTLVLTYYERPCGDSEGQIAVVVGENVVSRGPWPFKFSDPNRLNIVRARETPMRRRWTGATVLTSSRSLQRALNRAEDSIDEHMDKVGNARPVVEEGSINQEEWDDDPASIVTVRHGTQFTPAYMSPPSMPDWWQERPVTLKGDIDDMLHVHDVSRGEPVGAGSGVALGLLAEQDDTPLGALAKEFGEMWGRFATLVLETYADKVTDTRTAKRTKPGRLPEIIKWKGSDFAGQTVATVPPDAVAPTSRAQQFQKGLLLLDKGMFGRPGDPQTALRFAQYIDMPGAANLAVDLDPNVDKAERENHDMLTGNDIPSPAGFDNHAVHIATHNRMRMSAAYERADEQTRRIVDMHIEGHQASSGEELGKQVALGQVHPVLPTMAQGNEPPLAGTAGTPEAPPAPAGPAAAPGAPDVLGAAQPPEQINPAIGGQGGVPS